MCKKRFRSEARHLEVEQLRLKEVLGPFQVKNKTIFFYQKNNFTLSQVFASLLGGCALAFAAELCLGRALKQGRSESVFALGV